MPCRCFSLIFWSDLVSRVRLFSLAWHDAPVPSLSWGSLLGLRVIAAITGTVVIGSVDGFVYVHVCMYVCVCVCMHVTWLYLGLWWTVACVREGGSPIGGFWRIG